MSLVNKIIDGIVYACAIGAGVLLICAMLSVCLDVVLRHFFDSPLAWVLQFCEYVLLYASFLGAAYVLKHDGHINVDLLVGQFEPRTRVWFNVFSATVGLLVMAIITYVGYQVTVDYYVRGVPTLGSVRIPEFLVFLVIPLGSGLFALEFARKLYGHVTAAVNRPSQD